MRIAITESLIFALVSFVSADRNGVFLAKKADLPIVERGMGGWYRCLIL